MHRLDLKSFLKGNTHQSKKWNVDWVEKTLCSMLKFIGAYILSYPDYERGELIEAFMIARHSSSKRD